MSKARLVFLNRFYWPEEPATAQLLTDLAETMAASGRPVLVITSSPRGKSFPRVESRHGVVIHRIGGSTFGNRNLVTHAWDFLTFSLLALVQVARVLMPEDILIVMTDPPLLAIPAGMLARWRGARVIHWIQDIYPEAAIILTGRRIFKWLRPFRDRAWRAADACVTLGEDMAAAPRAAGVLPQKLFLVPNWAPAGVAVVSPADSVHLREEWGLMGKFVVAYFGNLGRVHDLDPVIDLAASLQDEPQFQFIFVGPGAQRPRLQAAARDRRLTNIAFFAAQPRERRSAILSLGDVHLVTLREGAERVVYPSKIYGICAAGRTVLYIGPTNCEIAHLVQAESLGMVFSRDNISGIADALRELKKDPARNLAYSHAGRRFYEQHASIGQAAAKWALILDCIDSGEAMTPAATCKPTS